MPESETQKNPIVLVTGPSGAGRTTAINVLEDLGFEAIENVPLRLVPGMIEAAGVIQPMALGLDSRNRDFTPSALLDVVSLLSGRPDAEVTLLYLDARADVLVRRFSETRRRHPLAPAETPGEGVRRDLDLMEPVRDRADLVLDTSSMNVHQLKAEMMYRFASGGRALALSVQSFSYKRGVPQGADMVFDCRFLANPYWRKELRQLDGRSAEVQAYVQADPRFADFYERVLDLTRVLLPAYRDEGKSHFSIAFGCTGGQHRSVTLAETLAKALAEDGQQVSIRHRELQGQQQN